MHKNISPLTRRINAAIKDGRTALIPFLPAGFPDKQRFQDEICLLAESGADIIEIGMPFSDPVADGPVVERASLQCLENGVNLQWIMQTLESMQQSGRLKPDTPAQECEGPALVLMGYYNPVLQYGLEKFAADAANAGVSGIIIADLPFEENAEIRMELSKHGIALIPLIGLNTPPERMQLYADTGDGFVYFVSTLGTTGGKAELSTDIQQQLKTARSVFSLPIALGFGLKEPAQLQALQGLVDAAVFGSALIEHIENGGDCSEFMARWK